MLLSNDVVYAWLYYRQNVMFIVYGSYCYVVDLLTKISILCVITKCIAKIFAKKFVLLCFYDNSYYSMKKQVVNGIMKTNIYFCPLFAERR